MANTDMELSLDWEGLFKSLQLTAMNQKNVSEQMGILTEGYKELKEEQLSVRSTLGSISNEIELLKSEQFVKPYQQSQYEPAIKNRVADLLRSVGRIDDKDVWSGFMKKCWSDCKTKSVMVGNRGVYTEKGNHEKLLNYIGQWNPEGYGGAIGYVNHLDGLRK